MKIGSSSLTVPSGGVNPDALARLVAQTDQLWSMGYPTVIVTSGAVASGLPAMGLTSRPETIAGLQVAAAIGQSRLMGLYASEFESRGRLVAQVLLSRDVLARREQYLHAREALDGMLAIEAVPIVNENDTVVVDELKLGDNDRLAAIVSHLVGASMLVLLSDTEGLYTVDPSLDEEATLLDAVHHSDETLDSLAELSRASGFGSGGVATKVAAARIAAWSGIPTVIASAREPDVLRRAVTGDEVGTWISPRPTTLPARKLWIAFGRPSAGTVLVDSGAAVAIVDAGKSLLAVGVTGVAGSFESGDAVEIRSGDDTIAKGLVRLAAAELETIRGHSSSVGGGVVIHRDDLVVLT